MNIDMIIDMIIDIIIDIMIIYYNNDNNTDY